MLSPVSINDQATRVARAGKPKTLQQVLAAAAPNVIRSKRAGGCLSHCELGLGAGPKPVSGRDLHDVVLMALRLAGQLSTGDAAVDGSRAPVLKGALTEPAPVGRARPRSGHG